MNENHPKINYGKTGVLLINLGTPDSTGWWDIRRYLKEFLSDKRVIEVNPFLWQIILNLFILTFRPSKTAKAYKEIWMEKENMSPLRYFTKLQAEKIDKLVKNMNDCSPEIMTAVPRFYQNLFSKISFNFSKQKGLKKKLINKTIFLGVKILNKEKLNFNEKIVNYLCEILVRRKVKNQFGGKLKAFVSGGGALDQKVGEFLKSKP